MLKTFYEFYKFHEKLTKTRLFFDIFRFFTNFHWTNVLFCGMILLYLQ